MGDEDTAEGFSRDETGRKRGTERRTTKKKRWGKESQVVRFGFFVGSFVGEGKMNVKVISMVNVIEEGESWGSSGVCF